VVVKIFIFWDIKSCCSVKVNRHSAGVHKFRLKVRRVSILDVGFLFGSLFDSENGSDMFLQGKSKGIPVTGRGDP
jgi:hypothetical protein